MQVGRAECGRYRAPHGANGNLHADLNDTVRIWLTGFGIDDLDHVRTCDEDLSIFPAHMMFVFQPDFQIGVRIHTFACDLMCGPVIVILILYVIAGDGALALADDPAANLFGNGVCGIETGLHSLAQRFADSIAAAHSAIDQRLFGVCAVCKEAGLRTVTEPGNGQLLADSLNHAPVDCAFDGCNVAPTITGNNRRQILLMDKRRGLLNLRDCTAGIVTVKYVDSKLCRCGNTGCRIRAARFNWDERGDLFPIFSSTPPRTARTIRSVSSTCGASRS